MEHDVFISYSTKNKEAAQAICHVLEQNEIRCWMAPRNIPPGQDYGDVIEDAIKDCKSVVVLFSETAAQSQYVKSEINIAFEEQKTIIPFRLDETPLKGQNRLILNKTHWIDAYPDYKTKFNDLVAAVALSVGREMPKEPEIVTIPQTIKHYKKHIIAALIISIIFVVSYIVYPLVVQQLHVYHYDNQGLHITKKGLTEQQENALTSILDNMVLVEGGTFQMGNTTKMIEYLTEQDSLSRNVHNVELSNFYISKFEVTQAQWRAFLSTDGRCIKDDKEGLVAMDMLSWEDAVAFADTLSHLTGLKFSLPTEAQWEFAARGGVKSNHFVFSGHDEPKEVGWTSFEVSGSAHKVGGKRYNELELYDMTGNVSEWCLDYFASYPINNVVDPQGPSKGMYRVLRGGDFRIENLWDMKVTTRYKDAPYTNRKGAGMRLVINKK